MLPFVLLMMYWEDFGVATLKVCICVGPSSLQVCYGTIDFYQELKFNYCDLYFAESFGQNYPEEFDGALDCASLAVTCAFNRRGTLLAVGCNDGRIVIWDFLTRGIAKIISAHVHPVCSLRSALVQA